MGFQVGVKVHAIKRYKAAIIQVIVNTNSRCQENLSLNYSCGISSETHSSRVVNTALRTGNSFCTENRFQCFVDTSEYFAIWQKGFAY